jgi:hypothetical protein
MSFQDSVSFECGSQFVRYYDCQQRQQRQRDAGAQQGGGAAAATAEDGEADPCRRPRQAIQVGARYYFANGSG